DQGAIALVDAYHAFNIAPIDWGPAKKSLYVTAGGYKYAGFGDGCCWLRVPDDCDLRPLDTGWFADCPALSGDGPTPITNRRAGLRGRGVLVDSRNDLLRIGPAPYLADDEIDRGVDAIAAVLRA